MEVWKCIKASGVLLVSWLGVASGMVCLISVLGGEYQEAFTSLLITVLAFENVRLLNKVNELKQINNINNNSGENN